MKMLEWLGAPRHALREAYLDVESYLVPREAAERFIALFRELTYIDDDGNGQRERRGRGRYDSLQMAKHLLAIFGRVASESAYHPGKIALLNCVWELANPAVPGRYEPKYSAMREEEHEGFAQFAQLACELVVPLFEALGIELSVEYVTACDLMDAIAYDGLQREKLM